MTFSNVVMIFLLADIRPVALTIISKTCIDLFKPRALADILRMVLQFAFAQMANTAIVRQSARYEFRSDAHYYRRHLHWVQPSRYE